MADGVEVVITASDVVELLPGIEEFATKIQSMSRLIPAERRPIADAGELTLVLRLHAIWLGSLADPALAVQGQRACLREADLRGAMLANMDLRGADFSGANLAGANLSGALLDFADLSCANLQGADLRGARMEGTVMSGAQLAPG